METFFPYEIPVWHPLLVHFPIAFILAGAGAVVAWSVRGAAFWRKAALLLFGLGMAGALGAYFTGEAMEEQSEGTPIVEELVGRHEDLALYTLVVTGAVLVALAMISSVQSGRAAPTAAPLPARMILAILALAAATLVAWTGHLGGMMVWGV